jgi:hypothetical protein
MMWESELDNIDASMFKESAAGFNYAQKNDIEEDDAA